MNTTVSRIFVESYPKSLIFKDFSELSKNLSARQKEYLKIFLLQSYGINSNSLKPPDLNIFVNAQSSSFNKEPNNICGDIEFAPIVVRKSKGKVRVTEGKVDSFKTVNLRDSRVLLDSGAFPEVRIDRRQTPEYSLNRQMEVIKSMPCQPKEILLVSYDRLIDEKYVNGDRVKQRWSVEEAEIAVQQTVEAAQYLDSQRRLLPYTLVQSCQGVDARQYLDCVNRVLPYCSPGDAVGLGGWCILGRQVKWMPTFWETINLAVPAIAEAGIDKIHIFGVSWYKPRPRHLPPLGSLLWLCDQYGIELSTDSRSPIGNALWKKNENSHKKAGAVHPYWRYNLALVRTHLATLRDDTTTYQPPSGWNQPQYFEKPIQLSLLDLLETR